MKLKIVFLIVTVGVSNLFLAPTYSRTSVNKEEISSQQQQGVISGIIIDVSTNQALPGVTVLVKGTTNGTLSDANGRYSFSGLGSDNILIFSYIGFGTQEVSTSGRTKIDIYLQPEVNVLDEMVVIGYGTVRRSDLVSSVASVAERDIKSQPVARVDQVLQGVTSGIQIQNISSAPNQEVVIRIRGANSLIGSNDPLVVVDGFVGGNLSTLNPNDIQSMEVLKDASATAIYGSRGANGVIMITTKRGGERTTVEYNSYVNFNSIWKKQDLLNAWEYAETVNANRLETNPSLTTLPFSQKEIDDWKSGAVPSTDWQDVIYRSAVQQSHQLSVSGGTRTGSYRLSANYVNNDGIIRGSSFNRIGIRSNVESTISDKFNTGLNIAITNSMDHPVQTRGNQDSSPVQAALIWGATKPVYTDLKNPDGTPAYSRPGGGYGSPAVQNPLALAIEPVRDNNSIRGELTSYINYNIVKGLSFRVTFGAQLTDSENSSYTNTKGAGNTGNATASINNSRAWMLQNTNQLNYVTTLGQDHNLNLTAVYEVQQQTNNNSSSAANGYSSDLALYNNLGQGTLPQNPSSGRTERFIISYVGRAQYSYKGKYLFNIAGRYDGSSVFGEDNKWGFFPSAGLKWRVSQESFMQAIPTFSDLSLRASYGVTGNQGVSPNTALATLSTRRYAVDGATGSLGIGPGSVANPALKWEKTSQYNVGVDVGLLKNRITAVFDYYYKKTNDLLLNVPIPRVSGFSQMTKNVGSVENQGYEFSIGGYPVVGQLRWNTNFNISFNRNKVLELDGSRNDIPVSSGGWPGLSGNTISLVVGQPMGTLKGYDQIGIWGTAEAAEAAKYYTIPGAPKYRDVNKDGWISGDDVIIMGNTLPKFTYGFTNNFEYKNFDLNIFIQGSQGNDVWNLTRVSSTRQSGDSDPTQRVILNRWTPTNQNTNIPSFSGSYTREATQSNRWLEDGSYVRLKTITLGYSLPQSITSSLSLSSARIYVSGVNLLIITKYTGYDPESATSSSATLGGIDMAPYPAQKAYTVGINLRF